MYDKPFELAWTRPMGSIIFVRNSFLNEPLPVALVAYNNPEMVYEQLQTDVG
ncbi:uncharacterized protein PGTG_21266 [Puccinia graminis f. sp. tritici CRL 75-36-700-3]|uniref:Uncharacterized protein n=1 Tax=Puccinia graminis f. sp. tritici (strain CRL 75-36-700-3 / race SCCL) TaxID=418459 RepID=H6QQX9_PUCGT|nr:uncharacterized protein PGTG_21266 [Puccinia graminis f. sp. tritici CRL 75-36-700-3]EHS62916.1 hypothetical protein PGTG_21266 [Puccinia graminis f. sp. tritici CRL 75-36-700-3]